MTDCSNFEISNCTACEERGGMERGCYTPPEDTEKQPPISSTEFAGSVAEADELHEWPCQQLMGGRG